MKKIISLALLLIFACPFSTANAQKKRPQDYNWFGAEIGFNATTFRADSLYFPAQYTLVDAGSNYVAPYGVRTDKFVPAYGFLIGGVVDFSLGSTFGIQSKLQYRTHNVKASGASTILCQRNDGTNETDKTTQNVSAALSMIGLSALLRVQIQEDRLYGLAGIEYSSVISNSATSSITLADGNCFWRSQPSGIVTTNKTLSSSGELFNFYNKSRLGLQLGVGDWFMLDNGWAITPEFMLSIPLTDLIQTSNIIVGDGSGDPAKNTSLAINGDRGGLYWAAFSVAIKFPWGDTRSSSAMNGEDNSTTTSYEQPGRTKLRGHVTDKSTGKPVDANLTVVDLSSNQVVQTGKTDRDGDYEFSVRAPGKYSVTADANGYLFGTAYFEVDENGRILREDPNIEMSPASGRTRLLVFFDFDKSNLQPSSYPALNRAADLMKSNPNMVVEIAGYTDAKGTHPYNMDLSQHRAASVRDYLVARGIDPKRITARGYAEADPIAPNDTEEGRAKNRRVEFVVTKK